MTCEVCARDAKCEKHRIVPGLKYGGKYVPENIVMVCRKCHDKIHYILRHTKRTDFEVVIEEVRESYEFKATFPNITLHK